MVRNQELEERRAAVVPKGVGMVTQIFADKALNAELWDVQGKRYIDFSGGIGVLNTGHQNPHVLAAVKAQLDRFSHTCFQVVPYDSYITLAERLIALAPGEFSKKAVFFSTGTEAVENAVKMARAFSGRTGIVAFAGGFHGRSNMTMALTGKVAPYRSGFGPFPAGIFHAAFPEDERDSATDMALADLDRVFSVEIAPEDVAAMIIEPVQGEGGFRIAPPRFLQALRDICDQHGILLIADEIQSGFARTGRMFAIEHADVAPDMITTAKSLAGGFLLSGVVGRADVMDASVPGGLGGTYAGNAIGCVAANAVLDVIESEGLLTRAELIGDRLKATIAPLDVSHVENIRRLGAMFAFDLVDQNGAPSAELAADLRRRGLESGLILLSCGPKGNTIRIHVPLTCEDEILGEGLEILSELLIGCGANRKDAQSERA